MTAPTTPTKPTRGAIARRPAWMHTLSQRAVQWLADYSVVALRISLGLVFLAFGALKFIPGASPAEELAVRTVDALSFGMVSGRAALLVTATAETFIGITLVTGKLVRAGLLVLAASMVGILSPMVLFFDELFPRTPTLVAQYVFKDIVLVTAGLVIAARTLTRAVPIGAASPDRRSPASDSRAREKRSRAQPTVRRGGQLARPDW